MVKRWRLLMVPLLAFGLLLGLSPGAWAGGKSIVKVLSKDTVFGSHAVMVSVDSDSVPNNGELHFIVQMLDRDGKVNIQEDSVTVVVTSELGYVDGSGFTRTFWLFNDGKLSGKVEYQGASGTDNLRFEVYYECESDECEENEPIAVVTIPVSVTGEIAPPTMEEDLSKIENIYIGGAKQTGFSDEIPGYYYNLKVTNSTGSEVAAGDSFKVFVFGNRKARGTAEVAFVRVVDDKGNRIPYPVPTKTVEVHITDGKGSAEVSLEKAGYYVVVAYVKGTSPVDSLKDACFYSGKKASDNATAYINSSFNASYSEDTLTGGCACPCDEPSDWCCAKDEGKCLALLHVKNAGFDHARFTVDYPMVSNATVVYNATALEGPMVPNFCVTLYDKYGNVYRAENPKTYEVMDDDNKTLSTIVVQKGEYQNCTWVGKGSLLVDFTEVSAGEDHVYAKDIGTGEELELETPGGAHTTISVVDVDPYKTSCNATLLGNVTQAVGYVAFWNGTSAVANETITVSAGDSFKIFVGNDTGVSDDVSARVYLYRFRNGVCTNELVYSEEVPQGDWEEVTGGKVVKVQVKKAGEYCVSVQFEDTKPRVGLCGILKVNPSDTLGEAAYVDLLGNDDVIWKCGNDKCGAGNLETFYIYSQRFRLEDKYGNVVVNGTLNGTVKVTEVRIENGKLSGDKTYTAADWDNIGYWLNHNAGSCSGNCSDIWYNGNYTVSISSLQENATLAFVLNKPNVDGEPRTYVNITIEGCGSVSVPSGACNDNFDFEVMSGPETLPPYGIGIYLFDSSQTCFANCTLKTDGMVLVSDIFDGVYGTEISYNASEIYYIQAVGQEGEAKIWLECSGLVSKPIVVNVKKVVYEQSGEQPGEQAKPVPSEQKVGEYEGNVSEAPAAYVNGKLDVEFNYESKVDIAVAVFSCDFEKVYWLNENCQLVEDFAYISREASVSCSSLELPVDAGYVVWLVSPVDLTALDWSNGAYELEWYEFGNCE